VAGLTGDRPPTSSRLFALAVDLERHPGPLIEQTDDVAAAGGAYDLAAPAAPAAASRILARRSRPSLSRERWLRVDRRSLPGILEHAVVRAQRVHTAEAEVRVVGEGERATSCWARAFDGDGTIIAMAPLRSQGRDAVAVLLVAPEIIDDVSVDVTDQPGLSRLSPAFESVQRAILDGRDAASAERAGDRKEAAISWHRSGINWREAGDDTRANTAAEFASGGVRGRRGGDRIPRALVADRVEVR
jgi:hypothetical protein